MKDLFNFLYYTMGTQSVKRRAQNMGITGSGIMKQELRIMKEFYTGS